MRKKPEIPKVSLVPERQTPEPAKQYPRDATLHQAALLRALGRPVRGADGPTPIDWRADAKNDISVHTKHIAARMLPRGLSVEMILDQSFNEVHVFNETTFNLIYVNEVARRNLQYSQDELDQLTIADIQPMYSVEAYARLLAPLKCGATTMIVLATDQRRKNGTHYPVEVRIQSARMESGRVFVCTVNDITERRLAQDAVRRCELAEITLQSIAEAVITVDAQGKVIYCNRTAEHLSGWSAAEARGQPLEAVFFVVSEETREPVELPFAMMLRQGKATRLADHMLLKSREGREYPIEGSVAPAHTRGRADAVVALMFHDDTQTRRRLRRLSYQASHDPLTKLANRRAFVHEAGVLLDNAKNTRKRHALMFIDLDRFKAVNDLHGHSVGDDLLCQIASLMADNAREADTVARLGGDEFAVLLEGCPLNQAQHFAASLIKAVQELPLNVAHGALAVGISVGLASITAHSVDLKSLLRAADTACYLAKKKGGDCLQVFELANGEALQREREKLIGRARDAVAVKPREHAGEESKAATKIRTLSHEGVAK